MKLLLINNAHYNRGGADNVYLNTGALLKNKGHEVAYFSTNDQRNHYSIYSDYFIENPNYKHKSIFSKVLSIPRYFYSFKAKKNLNKLINDFKPEIAHIHLLYGGGLTSSILPILKKNRIPIVLTIHDYKLLCPTLTLLTNSIKICEKCAKGNYSHCITNRCNQASVSNKKNIFNSVIFATESWFRDILFHYDKYVTKYIFVSNFSFEIHNKYKQYFKNKSIVLYNFIPLTKHKVEIKNDNYFLFFGRLSHEKGLFSLIEVFMRLENKKLLIVGEGGIYNELNEIISINKLKNIELKGHKSGQELFDLISNAKFVIVPSEWYENNPLSIIESYSQKTPVIASNIGGIPEIVINNHNGFLFEPFSVASLKDTIEMADNISDNDYMRLANNAFEFAKNEFNQESHYIKLMDLYNSII